MILREIRLQNFRNIPFAALELRGRRHFLLGRNAQGKTNLLEAAGFITVLRSFRTSDARALIRSECDEAALAYQLTHERLGETRVTVRLRADGKEVAVDQERIQRLSDVIGRFPAVVFSSEDSRLVRGAPGERRRFLDLVLASTDPQYLETVQRYHRALAERNQLIRVGRHGAELEAFEVPLSESAVQLTALRRAGAEQLQRLAGELYCRFAGEAESIRLAYRPDLEVADAADYRLKLRQALASDLVWKGTQRGPHRDDLHLEINQVSAKRFASEGQQRSLVLALRLAQAQYLRARSGIDPLILADDVLGELDPVRRVRFWEALDPAWQVMATGTAMLPDQAAGDWQVFTVEGGRFSATPSEKLTTNLSDTTPDLPVG